jgi:hypothetical protein
MHCCFDSNPGITERLSYSDIVKFIDEALAFSSLKLVVFSGGECFLLGDDLVKAVEYASERGLLTRCVTNGYWAESIVNGKRRLKELARAGLNELNISTGDFHQEWVPEQAVINAAQLGIEEDLDMTLIMVECRKERRVTANHLMANPQFKNLWNNTTRDKLQLIESPWMPMSSKETIEQPNSNMLNRYNLHKKKGCSNILKTIVINPSKEVGYCCGLTRERIPSLNDVWTQGSLFSKLEEAGRDFMKIWLLVDGPEKILAWAATRDPSIKWEDIYSHHCQVCLALFENPIVQKSILDNYKERIDDVLLRYSMQLHKQDLSEIGTAISQTVNFV